MIIQPNQIEQLFTTLNAIENIEEYISKSKYPNTLKAIWNLTLMNEQIYRDIETCDSSYTANCLLRISIECFLVQYYIYHRLISEQDDSVGTEYYISYKTAEDLKKENYNLRVKKIIKGYTGKLSFQDLKNSLSPKIDSITQKEYETLNLSKNKFDIVKIQKFILSSPIEGGQFDEINRRFIPDFLYVYNELCSHVHSGPFAAINIFKTNPKRINEARIVMWAIISNLFFSLQFADEKFDYLIETMRNYSV